MVVKILSKTHKTNQVNKCKSKKGVKCERKRLRHREGFAKMEEERFKDQGRPGKTD